MNLRKGVGMTITGAVAVAMIGLVPVNAAEEVQGNTTVTYNNQNLIEGAEWAVAIPTAVTFSDTKKEGDFSIELVGNNNYNIEEFNSNFNVKVKAKSTNGYKLKNVDITSEAEYQVKYDAHKEQAEVILGVTTGTESQDVGTLDKANAKRKGTATLTKKAAKKGSYTDTVTFTVTPSADSAVD